MSVVVVFGAEGCKEKRKKKPAATTPPLIVGSPIPPPQDPPTTDPNKPDPKPPGDNPIPTPPTTEPPKPVPEPAKPNPIPVPAPLPVPLDRYGDPIIPTTPVVADPHVILTTGVVTVMRNARLTAQICQDVNVVAYYVPCPTSLYCWEWFRPACGYFVCVRW